MYVPNYSLSIQQTAQLSAMDMSPLNPSLPNLQNRQLLATDLEIPFLDSNEVCWYFVNFLFLFFDSKNHSVSFLIQSEDLDRPFYFFDWKGNLFFRISDFTKMVFRPLFLLFGKDANYFLLFKNEANCLPTMDSRSLLSYNDCLTWKPMDKPRNYIFRIAIGKPRHPFFGRLPINP